MLGAYWTAVCLVIWPSWDSTLYGHLVEALYGLSFITVYAFLAGDITEVADVTTVGLGEVVGCLTVKILNKVETEILSILITVAILGGCGSY